MHYYLCLTSVCNLNCRYCQGKSVEDFMSYDESLNYEFDIPNVSKIKIDDLINFSKDDDNFVLTFYGGEPLLEINKIKEIINRVPAKDFMMQTNAQDLNKLSINYLNKISTILVSIDGTKKHTNFQRGNKVYENIISNVKKVSKDGYKGEIIARMTVDEKSNIYKNVTHLYDNLDYSFSSIHWQIDAQFFQEDYKARNFKYWLDNDYKPNLKKLIFWWLEIIKNTKKVPRIYPFVGIVYSLLTQEKSLMRCGAGHSCLGIQTNGKIVACPISAGYKPLYMGDVYNSTLLDVKKNKMFVNKQCLKCSILDICGGRCLYANKTQLWGEKGYNEVCESIFYLVDNLKSIISEIDKMIQKKEIEIEDFNYPRYNGCEIIP
ncbi:MAG: TIGR04084 family radical SAM/SPASM domain-containing protein [Nanoarchaeota archaeon]